MNKNNLYNIIKKKRPTIKNNSIDSYINYIYKLYNLYIEKNKDYDFKKSKYNFLKDIDNIKNIVNDKYKDTTKNNIYNSIIVVLMAVGVKKYKKEIEIYKELQQNQHSKYLELLENNKKTNTQDNNWMDYKDIIKLKDKYEKIFNDIYNDDLNITKTEFINIQYYVLLSIYLNYPLRNDVSNMLYTSKLSDTKNKDFNYLYKINEDEFEFILYNYKTNKTFGIKKIIINKDVSKILYKYIKILDRKFNILDNDKDKYLFYNSRLEPISRNGITKLFNRLFEKEFNKKISTSMIRHIYLSHKYSDDLKNRKTDSKNMGHDLETQKGYIKY